MDKGAEMKRKARDGGRRRETKPNGYTHQQGEEKKEKTRSWKQNNLLVDC